MQALVYVLLVGIIAGLVGWINQSYIKEEKNWYMTMKPYMIAQVRPYVLSSDAERILKRGNPFRECAKDCPEMTPDLKSAMHRWIALSQRIRSAWTAL